MEYRFEEAEADFDLEKILAAARRRLWLVVLFGLLGLLLGLAYIATAVPLYTSSAQLLIDTRDMRSAQEASVAPDLTFDEGAVSSQVEVLESEKLAEAVVDQLGLVDDPMFMRSETGLVSRAVALAYGLFDVRPLLDRLTGGQPEAAFPVEAASDKQKAVSKLRNNLEVARVERSYVLSISYTSTDPGRAAQIANGYAEAYITDKLDAKYEATRRASAWLQQRIAETRDEANAADLAVEQYKAENDLVASDGKFLADQQLTGLNGQLIAARAEAAQAEARYRRIRTIIDTGETDAAVSEALNSGIISDLRTKYLDASKRYQEIASLLGANHAQTLKLHGEMMQYKRLIFEELKRIAQVYKSDLDIANSRVGNLETSIKEMAGANASHNEREVALRELEQRAETLRNLHQTLLERYEDTAQRESFPITEARIITKAARGEKTHPRTGLTLALAAFLGLAFGGGLGAFVEYRDRVFRTSEQVRDELDLEFIGMLNLVAPKAGATAKRRRRRGNRELLPQDAEMDVDSPLLRYSLDVPLSAFAEVLRTTKVAVDLTFDDKKPKVVGVFSMLPSEGKTTVAKNLASLIAAQGPRTLLIDADLRNPGLSRAVAPSRDKGLVDALIEQVDWKTLLLTERESGLVVLPTSTRRSISHTADLVSSPRMRGILTEAGPAFEYIFVDLPPIEAVVDARAMLPLLDAMVLVVEWGETDRKLVRRAFENDRRLHDKCVGVIFNKVDKSKMRLYESYQSGYYSKSYKNYYSS
ncbi:polysaccharide biosynthesis tyrosine autokinase [Consotaella aegiceratis]|uniref:polysaccharide biosynthesis tyrosine autokinase n=1 Tax=Consotaella aegiceratis TaxID=3097961 RepID=UPI002F3E9311